MTSQETGDLPRFRGARLLRALFGAEDRVLDRALNTSVRAVPWRVVHQMLYARPDVRWSQAPPPAPRQGWAPGPGGSELYWKLTGTGRRTIVCCNGAGVGRFFWRWIERDFHRDYQILTWDYPGHGNSTMGDCTIEMECFADALEAVMEAAGVREAICIGHSMGAQVMFEHLRRHPGRSIGMVSVLGTFGHALATFGDIPNARVWFERLFSVVDRFPGPVGRVFGLAIGLPIAVPAGVVMGQTAPTVSAIELREYLDHIVADLGLPRFIEVVRALDRHGVQDTFPEVTVPTLIIGGDNDFFSPVAISRAAADAIPSARYIQLDRASHAAIIEQQDEIAAALRTFLHALPA